MGLHDTPYENGFFLFILKYDNNYPFYRPHFRFLTKMFHAAEAGTDARRQNHQGNVSLTVHGMILSARAAMSHMRFR